MLMLSINTPMLCSFPLQCVYFKTCLCTFSTQWTLCALNIWSCREPDDEDFSLIVDPQVHYEALLKKMKIDVKEDLEAQSQGLYWLLWALRARHGSLNKRGKKIYTLHCLATYNLQKILKNIGTSVEKFVRSG